MPPHTLVCIKLYQPDFYSLLPDICAVDYNVAMDQSKLVNVFNHLKTLLQVYEPELRVIKDLEGRYELEFDKSYTVRSERTGKITTKQGMYFAGIIIQSNYVGLYFMPIYGYPDEFADLPKWLKRTLKGKSCFHFTSWQDAYTTDVAKMLKEGYRLFATKS